MAGLSVNKIPTSPSHQDSVEHATHSLRCLARLIDFDGPVGKTLFSFVLEQQEKIFSWMSFLLRSGLSDPTPKAPGLPLLVAQVVFGYLSHHLKVDYTVYIQLSDAIMDLWHKIQDTTITGMILFTLAESVNNLVGHSLRFALSKTPAGGFVKLLGGTSRIPDLYSACLSKYLESIPLSPPSDHYPLTVLMLQNTSLFLCLFRDNLLPHTILSEKSTHQVSRSIKHIFEHHSQIDASLMEQFEDVTASYLRWIFYCPARAGYYPILDMLQLGIADHFRALETRTFVVDSLGRLLFVYAKFPAALPLIERLMRLPAPPSVTASWSKTDTLMRPFMEMWDEAQVEAKSYTGCVVFPVPATEIPLLHFPLDIPFNHVENQRFQDFPELFDSNKKIRQVVVPRLKDFITLQAIPDYLNVLSLHFNDEVFHILSPSAALVVGNLPSIVERDM
ncbi:hypothetical protein ONZ45_g13378 [Pleurotus djamor]|nr:hypothetical protein ONZ45_g13378 [Pleurotus djamor]